MAIVLTIDLSTLRIRLPDLEGMGKRKLASPPLGGRAVADGVILRFCTPRGKPPGAVRQMVKGNLIKRLVTFNRYPLVTNGTDMESWRHHWLPPPVQFPAA
ncbi:hypothetical protein ES708_32210 [subsurface metagenome]